MNMVVLQFSGSSWVKGACLVGHGSSNETAIKNGILVAARTVRLDVSGIIAQTVSTAQ